MSGQTQESRTFVFLTVVRTPWDDDGAMTITASRLRDNVYKILDEVLDTGTPVEIERRGQRLRIVPAEPKGRLERLIRRPRYLKEDPESIVHLDWSDQWRP
jgi:antitoxin (DNA-binding transcriptional repressor) of toxin-antitoxin stability system